MALAIAMAMAIAMPMARAMAMAMAMAMTMAMAKAAIPRFQSKIKSRFGESTSKERCLFRGSSYFRIII